MELQSGRTSRETGREGERSRESGRGEVEEQEADVEATGGRKNPGDGAGADRDHESKLEKLEHKIWDMFLTLIGSFFGTVFLALGPFPLSPHLSPSS